MKTLLILIVLLLPVLTMAELEVCDQTRDGVTESIFHIDLSRNSSGLISHIEVKQTSEPFGKLIYDRNTNELIGEKAFLPIPPFKDYETWMQECEADPLPYKCDIEEYENAKQAYENSPQWVLTPGEVKDDDPNYMVLKTHYLSVTEYENVPVELVRQFPKVYQSSQQSLGQQTLTGTNLIDDKISFPRGPVKTTISFTDRGYNFSLSLVRQVYINERWVRIGTDPLVATCKYK